MKYRRICDTYVSPPTKIKRTKIGDRFGKLTISERFGTDKQGAIIWKCKCDCGGFINTRGYHLTRGHSISCGCWQAGNKIDQCIEYLQKWGYQVIKKQV